MVQEIIVKRSSVEGKVPETLKAGELAMNLVDQALYSSNVNGTIFRLNPTYVSVEAIKNAIDILPEEIIEEVNKSYVEGDVLILEGAASVNNDTLTLDYGTVSNNVLIL